MGKKFLKVVQVGEVQDKLLDSFSIEPLFKSIPVNYSSGYFLAEDISSILDIPPFDKSLVDGFAVRSSDIKGANASNPAMLSVLKEVKIGTKPDVLLEKGTAVFVPTGGYLPEGADCVVMIEYTDSLNNSLFVMKDVAPNKNVLRTGVDVKYGELVLKKGERITPRSIGVLKSAGIKLIKVFKPVKIGLFSTGDELSDQYPLPIGKIYDYNRISLMSQMLKDGFTPTDYGILKDDPDILELNLKRALSENNVVVMSGGTSKGNFDFTVSVINKMGSPGVLIHGLNVSPGKPSVFGVVQGKLIAGLSGNPLAATLIYLIIVKDLIMKKLSLVSDRISVIGELTENVPSKKGRSEIVIGFLSVDSDRNIIQPIFSESAFVTTLQKGNGFFVIPQNKEGLYKGEKVKFEIW